MQDKIRNRASRVIHQAISSSDFLTQLRKAANPKTWIATVVMSLGLSSSLWLMTATNTPQIAQAQTASVDLRIDRQPNETYENLIKRAEAAAKAAVTQSFNQNKEATDVSITVVGHNHGAVAPVLSLDVSRNDWSNFNPRRWITHFSQARSLLGFDGDVATSDSDRQDNTNSIRNNRTRRYSPTRGQNTSPSGTNRPGTFSQPGRLANPSTSGQPSNNNIPGQSGTGNPTNTPSGAVLTPSSPATAPINSSGQQQNSNPSSPLPGAGLTPQPPVIPSANQSSQQQNLTSPSGAGLTPQAPVIPSTNPSGQAPTSNFSPSNTPQNSTTPINSSGTDTEYQDQFR